MGEGGEPKKSMQDKRTRKKIVQRRGQMKKNRAPAKKNPAQAIGEKTPCKLKMPHPTPISFLMVRLLLPFPQKECVLTDKVSSYFAFM